MSLETARTAVLLHPENFRDDFYEWLTLNYRIFYEFESEADLIWASGRRKWGHRTIWEYIRRETALREVHSEYKLNDHYTKGCAVLYMMLHPDKAGFFELRERVV